MKFNGDRLKKYQVNYSEKGFWDKLKKSAVTAGEKVVYTALLLYYVLKSPDVSKKDKTVIIGALGYLILPTDLIPDFFPIAGYADDLAALLAALRAVWVNVTPAIKDQARAKINVLKNGNQKSTDAGRGEDCFTVQ